MKCQIKLVFLVAFLLLPTARLRAEDELSPHQLIELLQSLSVPVSPSEFEELSSSPQLVDKVCEFCKAPACAGCGDEYHLCLCECNADLLQCEDNCSSPSCIFNCEQTAKQCSDFCVCLQQPPPPGGC